MATDSSFDHKRALVFSHPNHELAVLGLVQRARPQLIFLTDGGGPEREGETRRSLERIGLRSHAHFLGYAEADLYAGLLARDFDFFAELARRVRKALEAVGASEIWCDAVEFYNPVHDLTLPVVRRALQGLGRARVYEIPLIYERREPAAGFEVQRFPSDEGAEPVHLELTDEELSRKIHARDEFYGLLRAQLGPLLGGPDERFAVEEFAPATERPRAPGGDRTLRYERRGALLHERGEVDEVITWADHYRPVADALLGPA